MTTERETLPVLFRVVRGELIAYFPTMEWNRLGDVTCYAAGEGHCGAMRGYLRSGRPAKPEEYADLLAELRGIYGTSRGEDDPAIELRVYSRDPSRTLKRAA